MFVNRRLDNSEPLAKISPEILQKIETVQTTIGVATSNNTPDTIVKRDANKDFAAGTVKLDAIESNGAVLNIATQNETGTVNIGSGAGVQNINLGNSGNGITTINLGGAGDKVNMGTVDTPAGAMTLYPSGMALNGRIIGGGSYFPADLTMSAVAPDGSAYASGYFVNSGRILLSGRCHNSSHGAKPSTSGIQSQTMANNVNPVQSKLVFLTSSTGLGSPVIVESASIDNNGQFSCASVESTGTTLNIASQNNTNIVNIGSGAGVQAINVGNSGAGKTTITLGGGTDEVKVNLPLKDSTGASILNLPTSNCMIGKNVFNSLQATNTTCTGFGVNIGYSTAEGLSHNTFVGSDIAQNAAGVFSYCVAVGSGALKNVNAVNNTAMGYNTLSELTTGFSNTGIGIRTGSAHTAITTGSNNTFIGATAGSDNANRINGTAIGQNARVDFDNCVQLGNALVTQVRTSGTITAATPTADTHLTTKLYVDNKVAAVSNQPLKTTDVVTFAGLILPNAGGSASTLSHYEEYDWVFL